MSAKKKKKEACERVIRIRIKIHFDVSGLIPD